MVLLVSALLLSVGALPAASRAQITPPQAAASAETLSALIFPLLSYQGRLVESGVAVTGYRDVTFRLWDAASAGTKVWEEGPKSVWVSDGLFTAILGDTTALPVNWFGHELWLEVQVGAVRLPRQKLMGAPYAMSLAPGAQVVGSKTAGEPAVVTVENVGTGLALDVAGSGSSAGGVLRLTANGGRVMLAQNKSSTQLFTLEANGDVTQSPAAGGLVKAAIAAQCANEDSAIQRYYTHGRNPTVTDGDSEGRCTIDPGFDPSARYWTVTAPAGGSIRLASCAVSDGQLQCTRTDVDGAGVNGPIHVLIY
jgi:hypothetical protein